MIIFSKYLSCCLIYINQIHTYFIAKSVQIKRFFNIALGIEVIRSLLGCNQNVNKTNKTELV